MFAVEAFEKALGITSKTISSMAHHKKDGRSIMHLLFTAHSRHKGAVINYSNLRGMACNVQILAHWNFAPLDSDSQKTCPLILPPPSKCLHSNFAPPRTAYPLDSTTPPVAINNDRSLRWKLKSFPFVEEVWKFLIGSGLIQHWFISLHTVCRYSTESESPSE